MKFDAIVAGAGLWGCTIARRQAEAGRRVLVLEKRKAVGGNCRCRTEKGIEVHLYGSHIFHTSNEEVWKFVNRFVSFNDYCHSVLANHGGKIYHLPIGCTLLKEFFSRDLKPSELMLDHPNIRVKCNAPFVLQSAKALTCPIYYSGPIDQLFSYRLGHLPWRTLRFETEHLPRRDFQGTAVMNYSDASVPYTRIHEFRHYHPEKAGAFAKPQGTIITREYSDAWKPGDEPYYPIDNANSRELLAKYRQLVDSYNAEAAPNGGKLIVGGRLGEYRYYDMDKTIAAALDVTAV